MAKRLTEEIVFLGARRTAFGTFNGALEKLTATDLGVHAAKAAIEQRCPRLECELFGASSGQHPINQGGLRLTDGSTGHT